MKSAIIRYFMAAVLLSMAFSIHAKAIQIDAVAGNVKGDVQWSPYDDDSHWRTVREHQDIRIGDRVKTGQDSSLSLSFANGNVIAISPMSIVKIEELRQSGQKETKTKLNVEQGRMLAFSKKLEGNYAEFTVKTPYGIAGARGSEIAVTVDNSSATLQVVSGVFEVEVGGAKAELTAGKQMELTAGATAPPAPVDIAADVLQAIQSELQVQKAGAFSAEDLEEAEVKMMDEMDDMIDIIDYSGSGACHTYCQYWLDGVCMSIENSCH